MNLRPEDLESTGPPPRLAGPVEALAVLVAAGRSERLPGHLPKQFLPLAGLPLLVWAAKALDTAAGVVGILPVYPPGLGDRVVRELSVLGSPKILSGVEGGETRQQSVARGVQALPPVADLILVHDAARPLASAALVERVLEAAALHGAAVPVRPLNETIKEVEGDRVVRTLDRSHLAAVQTPQGFRRELLVRAVNEARDLGVQATDEAALVERLGRRVATVPGEASNLKVTEPQDLELAEHLLRITERTC